MDLFEHASSQSTHEHAPLAERMRPQSIDDIVGQDKLLGPHGVIRSAVKQNRIPSAILWGPPGTGKTTLARLLASQSDARFEPFSAVTEGVPQLRKKIAEAKHQLAAYSKQTILFIDEIHRFNRAQQDALLPHVEDGSIILIGATTENPSFAVNNALLSRTRVFQLQSLDNDALVKILKKAIVSEHGLVDNQVQIPDEILLWIAKQSDGDARMALQSLQIVTDYANAQGQDAVNIQTAQHALTHKARKYDKSGQDHYEIISAFIKSMRGSDADAAIYWLARMLDAGEDPLFISRRMMIFASEDVGNADPYALQLAIACDAALRRLGLPEANFALAQCCLYLSRSEKSNETLRVLQAAKQDVEKHGSLPVPTKLRNAATNFMKQIGYGEGYRYPHDEGGIAEGETYLPEELIGTKYTD